MLPTLHLLILLKIHLLAAIMVRKRLLPPRSPSKRAGERNNALLPTEATPPRRIARPLRTRAQIFRLAQRFFDFALQAVDVGHNVAESGGVEGDFAAVRGDGGLGAVEREDR